MEKLLLSRVVEMTKYRGFSSVNTINMGKYIFVYGSNQSNELHPRPSLEMLVIISKENVFSATVVTHVLELAVNKATGIKLPRDSSLVYVYNFANTKKHTSKIKEIYRKLKRTNYYLELLHVTAFRTNTPIPRQIRNLRLVREEEFVLAETKDGEPIIIKNPLLVSIESPVIAYIGGRLHDYIEFERLTWGEVGPLRQYCMRKIVLPTEITKGLEDKET